MESLQNARNEIDAIDQEMAKLFERRMKVCRGIAEYKRERALPIQDSARESTVIDKGLKRIADPELQEYYACFLRDMMKTSRDYQTRLTEGMRVVYSGVEGAFAHIAAKRAFPNAQLFSVGDFKKAYRAVEAGEYDCAVLPIENSYAGDVGAVMDLMFSGSLYVNRMIELKVEHNLLACPDATMEGIRTVVSHPQALEQCAEFIRAHGWETLAYTNTAVAAKYVSEANDPTIAAIASDETASLFGLNILAQGVNASQVNTTRFAVFTRALHLPDPKNNDGSDHFILVFTTRNEAGALALPLNIIGAHDFNMRNLRSRPMKDLNWSYYFFVEAEGNINTQSGQNMLSELSAVCAKLKLVGTYSEVKA